MKCVAGFWLACLLTVAGCAQSDKGLWLAGIGGAVFPLLPAGVGEEQVAPETLPKVGQQMYLFSPGSGEQRARVSSIEMEPDNCMYYTELTYENIAPQDLFFLVSPRPIVMAAEDDVALDDKSLSNGVVQYLQAAGIANPEIRITKAVRAKLGDKSMVVVVAEQMQARGADVALPGEFSIVAVGETDHNSYKIVDAVSTIAADAETDSLPQRNYLLGFPDFDGDGQFEMATWAIGYEWMDMYVWSFSRGELRSVAMASCGS